MEVRHEEAYEDPHGSPFGNVPPPSSLDGKGKGKGKGKEKGKGKYKYGDLSDKADGLIVSNVPPELNSLDVLNRHFRQFGEVLKINSSIDEGKAFVQFADANAAQAAASVPVCDRPDILLAWAPKAAKGGRKGGKGGKGLDLGKGGPTAENRVLVADPEALRQEQDGKRKRGELADRKAKLLGMFTDQMKAIMTKISDERLSEEKREALRTMMLTIKEKMDALGNSGPRQDMAGPYGRYDEEPPAKKGKGKGKAKPSWSGSGDFGFTLDNRTRVLRMNLAEGWTTERLRDELQKFGGAEVDAIYVEASAAEEPQEGEEAAAPVDVAYVRFKDRWSAEQVFGRRSELPDTFDAEWCSQPPVGAPAGWAAEAEQYQESEAVKQAEAAKAADEAFDGGDGAADLAALAEEEGEGGVAPTVAEAAAPDAPAADAADDGDGDALPDFDAEDDGEGEGAQA